jgi:hypothetical protein
MRAAAAAVMSTIPLPASLVSRWRNADIGPDLGGVFMRFVTSRSSELVELCEITKECIFDTDGFFDAIFRVMAPTFGRNAAILRKQQQYRTSHYKCTCIDFKRRPEACVRATDR